MVIVTGVFAALVWAYVAVRAATLGDDLPVAPLVMCAALVMAGIALGTILWITRAPVRALWKQTNADRAENAAIMLMIAFMFIGTGVSGVLDASAANWWNWSLAAVTSVFGGLYFGILFMMTTERENAPSVPNPAQLH